MNDNIKQAIDIETQYWKDKISGKEYVPLNIQLQALGFSTIEEYVEDKQHYDIKTYNKPLYELDAQTTEINFVNSCNNSEASIYIPIFSKLSALVPVGFNKDALFIENGVTPYRYGSTTSMATLDRGIIIIAEEDLAVTLLLPKQLLNNNLYFSDLLYNYILKFFNNATLVKNDILIDDKKVMGCSISEIGDMKAFGYFFSFVDRSELIYKLCPPKTGKVPGYIDSTILSKYTLKNAILTWLL